jgi:predicted amidohydrolase YtcJ
MGTGAPARGVILANHIVKAGCVYALDAERHTFRSLAVPDGWIVAASQDADGLDALADARTHVVDRPDLTVLPAFFDIHEHLLESGRNLARVQAQDAGSIGELIAMLRERAKNAPSGTWVQTTMGWSESNLAERRLPTAAELDQASAEHPILYTRGGHACVANTLALRLANVDKDSPHPAGGVLED